MSTVILEIDFDERFDTMTRADAFQALMVEEFEFGPYNDETKRREKDGWGIGTRLVTTVLMLEPKGGHEAQPKTLLFQFEFNGDITEDQKKIFTALVDAEMSASSWGFGTARVLSVERVTV